MSCFKIKYTMFKIKSFVLLLLLCLFLSHNSIGQSKFKIVCIGDDLTYGVGAVNSEKNNYPTQLSHLLGSSYEVSKSKPADSVTLKNKRPNVVVVELGRNEINLLDTTLHTSFEQHILAFIQSIKQYPSHPRIILLLPTPCFATNSIKYNAVIKNQLIPLIQKIAYTTGVELLDIYSLLIDRSDLSTDQIHPNSLGATVISKRVYELIKLNSEKSMSIFTKIKQKLLHRKNLENYKQI